MFPFAITRTDMDRGQQRYNIFCAPCHARSGEGDGMVVQRGYRQPPSLHIDRLRQAPAGQIFDRITNGFGVMPNYRPQIAVGGSMAHRRLRARAPGEPPGHARRRPGC